MQNTSPKNNPPQQKKEDHIKFFLGFGFISTIFGFTFPPQNLPAYLPSYLPYMVGIIGIILMYIGAKKLYINWKTLNSSYKQAQRAIKQGNLNFNSIHINDLFKNDETALNLIKTHKDKDVRALYCHTLNKVSPKVKASVLKKIAKNDKYTLACINIASSMKDFYFYAIFPLGDSQSTLRNIFKNTEQILACINIASSMEDFYYHAIHPLNNLAEQQSILKIILNDDSLLNALMSKASNYSDFEQYFIKRLSKEDQEKAKEEWDNKMSESMSSDKQADLKLDSNHDNSVKQTTSSKYFSFKSIDTTDKSEDNDPTLQMINQSDNAREFYYTLLNKKSKSNDLKDDFKKILDNNKQTLACIEKADSMEDFYYYIIFPSFLPLNSQPFPKFNSQSALTSIFKNPEQTLACIKTASSLQDFCDYAIHTLNDFYAEKKVLKSILENDRYLEALIDKADNKNDFEQNFINKLSKENDQEKVKKKWNNKRTDEPYELREFNTVKTLISAYGINSESYDSLTTSDRPDSLARSNTPPATSNSLLTSSPRERTNSNISELSVTQKNNSNAKDENESNNNTRQSV